MMSKIFYMLCVLVFGITFFVGLVDVIIFLASKIF